MHTIGASSLLIHNPLTSVRTTPYFSFGFRSGCNVVFVFAGLKFLQIVKHDGEAMTKLRIAKRIKTVLTINKTLCSMHHMCVLLLSVDMLLGASGFMVW